MSRAGRASSPYGSSSRRASHRRRSGRSGSCTAGGCLASRTSSSISSSGCRYLVVIARTACSKQSSACRGLPNMDNSLTRLSIKQKRLCQQQGWWRAAVTGRGRVQTPCRAPAVLSLPCSHPQQRSGGGDRCLQLANPPEHMQGTAGAAAGRGRVLCSRPVSGGWRPALRGVGSRDKV